MTLRSLRTAMVQSICLTAVGISLLPLSASGQTTSNTVKLSDVSIGNELAVTFYLPLNNAREAEAAAAELQNPSSRSYHQFLSVSQFVNRYASSDAQVEKVERILKGMGFTIQYVYPNHLAIEAISPTSNAASVLGLNLKRFTVKGRTGTASTTPVTLPSSLQGLILGVGGINTMAHAHPMHLTPAVGHSVQPQAVPSALTGGSPGDYLPADFANFYNVNPIYARGISGRGTTIGIVTLNDFKPADAYLFWKLIGLKVSQTRITKVSVDGGVTASTNNLDGEGETDIDVEESGALAPNANVRVYIAPNITNANFINGFEAAASENIADTVSTSWGQPEVNYFYDIATKTPAETWMLQAFHEAFLEMALQGQTLYVASGDSGAFDTVRECPVTGPPATEDEPLCNSPYAVDHPASDPLVTAAGGTTLPFSFSLNDGVVLTVKHEQAWGWDYISTQAAEQGHGADIPVSAVFSVGDGGGVSSFWPLPSYQFFTPGITLTKPGQSFKENTGSGLVLQSVLPPFFLGRNMPDLSTNADPESGYQFIEEDSLADFEGGTSFVAPQLNGVTALFVEGLGHRVGQINPALYRLGESATTDIRGGDNWGYKAEFGYDNAAGLGVLDANKLLNGLKH
jgi:kumamolisin